MLQKPQDQLAELIPVMKALWIIGTVIFILTFILGTLADLGY